MRPHRRVALFMNIHGGYDHDIARGVIRYAKEHGNWQLFGHGWTLAEIIDLKKWNGDGVITRGRNREEAEELARLGIPIIDVCGSGSAQGIDQVTNDDVETGRIGAAHLKACGFSFFAYVGSVNMEWSSRRLQGFLEGLGLKQDQISVYTKEVPQWKDLEDPKLKEWLKNLRLPCAILAGDDIIGVKITQAAKDLGLRVPHQIAVIGVDNEVVLCELANPSLSSIPCNCERIGYEAAKVLEDLICGNRKRDGRVRIPPLPPVVRSSSDVMAVEDEHVARALRFIRAKTGEPVNVDDVSKEVPLSRRALEIRFRKVMGHTIHDEIRRVKLEYARKLLATTDMPVGKVGLEAGFTNAQRFHQVFVEHVGKSPLQYREEVCGR